MCRFNLKTCKSLIFVALFLMTMINGSSSFAAETIAALDAADALMYAGHLYEELRGKPIKIFFSYGFNELKGPHTKAQQQCNRKETKGRLEITQGQSRNGSSYG